VNYLIKRKKDHLLIKISGDTRRNEALLAKRMLIPYLKKESIKVIIDLEDLGNYDPTTLIGILSGIKKEIILYNGKLKLKALSPDLLEYLTEYRMKQVFKFDNI
jgi:anti-anti-sigma regulatory factor